MEWWQNIKEWYYNRKQIRGLQKLNKQAGKCIKRLNKKYNLETPTKENNNGKL